MAYLNTLNNYHLVQQLLLFCHHDQQLHDRNHKGPQRIRLHQYQSHLTVTKYRSKLSYVARVRFGIRVWVRVRRDLAIKKLLKIFIFIFSIYFYY